MYLTKPQYDALSEACYGKPESVESALIQWLLENGLIEPEMFGYRCTEFGQQSMDETYIEREQLKKDQSQIIGIFKREKYTADDDMTMQKRKPLDPTPTKAKPQTKYK